VGGKGQEAHATKWKVTLKISCDMLIPNLDAEIFSYVTECTFFGWCFFSYKFP
jgi:hypothetical protein